MVKPYFTAQPYDRKEDGPPRISTRLVAAYSTFAYFEHRHEAETAAHKLDTYDDLLAAAKLALASLMDPTRGQRETIEALNVALTKARNEP